eukprot:5935088-Pleurochrysis_carterae.AAC.1
MGGGAASSRLQDKSQVLASQPANPSAIAIRSALNVSQYFALPFFFPASLLRWLARAYPPSPLFSRATASSTCLPLFSLGLGLASCSVSVSLSPSPSLCSHTFSKICGSLFSPH